jgi:RNA-dependent RNA polymerase
MELVYENYRRILNNGIHVGNRKYFFLAMSASQLRLHSSWLVTPYIRDGTLVGADFIRSWLGDFSPIRNICKYAARLGQGLSSTLEGVEVPNFSVEEDVYSQVEGDNENAERYCFSDGIGRISLGLAERVCKAIGKSRIPSAFQIRFGGSKGVVSLDHRLNSDEAKEKALENGEASDKKVCGVDLILRRSMIKFESNHRILEVVTFSQYIQCNLNRQVITILESLGVDGAIFLKMQDEYIKKHISSLIRPFSDPEEILPRT